MRYHGNEQLILNGKELPHSMLEYWQVYYSDILLNLNRGVFAEYIVRCALKEGGFDALSETPTGMEAYDINGPMILTPQGLRPCRIEVKSAASIQRDTPDEKEPLSLPANRIVFGIRSAIDWSADDKIPRHNNDLYIFAHYTATRKADNMLDLANWDFYVYPTYKINENTEARLSEQKTISLRRLQMLGVSRVSFEGLHQEIMKTCAEIEAHCRERS